MTSTTLTLSVSELTQAIKFQLEKQFFNVSVKGEISNYKKQSSGHLYFTLKDSASQIQCVMFASDARTLKAYPKVGDQVTLMGEINVYPPRGNYQIIVRSIQGSGRGELLLLLEARKKKYLDMGWYDASLKKPLPKNPRKIGVVTSPTGAVIQDILQILNRRAHGFHLLLNPVKVQGEGAKEEISRAIDQFNEMNLVDVILVARGGGSVEDLWAFNEECVIESVHKSEIPIISAVGHETDTTLCDLVADVRAPTPSAAAELAIEASEKKWEFLSQASLRLNQLQESLFNALNLKLDSVRRHPYLLRPDRLLGRFKQSLDEQESLIYLQMTSSLQTAKSALYEKKLKHGALNPSLRIQKAMGRLLQFEEQIKGKIYALLQSKKSNLLEIKTHIEAIDPKKLLEKGYSILFDEKKNSAIVSVNKLQLKQSVSVVLKDGTIKAHVDEISPK